MSKGHWASGDWAGFVSGWVSNSLCQGWFSHVVKAIEFPQLSVIGEKTFSLQSCKILCLARKHFLPATPDKYIGCYLVVLRMQ